MSGKAYQEVGHSACRPESTPAVAATVAEALEEREAGGLRERSTGHDVILCCGVRSWEGGGLAVVLPDYFPDGYPPVASSGPHQV